MTRRLPLLLTLLASACAPAPGVPPAPGPLGPFRPGEVMVAWADAGPHEVAGARLVAGASSATQLLAVPAGEELAFCARLRARQGVVSAEPNWIKRTQHLAGSLRHARSLRYAPNDPAFEPSSPMRRWALEAVKAPAAWDTTSGSPAVVVAVVDTGVDPAHPDLAGNLDLGGLNLVERGAMHDDFGHGTHVAGIVAAVGDNAQGAVGVAWKTRVLPIRVLGADGTGSAYDMVSAVEYAIAKKVRVINLSLGAPDRSEIEARAIQKALDAGIVVVAAAGNEAEDGNPLSFPASYPGVVSVAAVDSNTQGGFRRAPFSNFNPHVTVAAPGVDIYSTLPTRYGAAPYGYLSGTSMAAPMVAGACALVFAAHPGWTGAQVARRLRDTAGRIAKDGAQAPDVNNYFGFGLVDAQAAVGN